MAIGGFLYYIGFIEAKEIGFEQLSLYFGINGMRTLDTMG